MTEENGGPRWPRPLTLSDLRNLKDLDYEVADLLARQRGKRIMWNTEQQVWYTYTPETVTDAISRRWIKNGGGGELAQNQVNRFAREMIDLIDDRVQVINRQLMELEGREDDDSRRLVGQLRMERQDIEKKRELVDAHRNRLNLTSILKTEPKQHVALRELDGDPHLLNFLNGTYDVRTGELREHRPEDKITHVVPYELDERLVGRPLSQTAPQFWGMLWRSAGAPGELPDAEHEELVAAMLRWMGYKLHGSNPEKLIAIWKGASNIGKTQILEIICKLLGVQLSWPTASNKLITVVQNRHDSVTSPLAGRRAVLINELHRKQHLDEHMILQLVNPEGGGVELRLMRKDSFATNITWKLTVTTNDLPQSELPPQIQNRLFLFQLSERSIPAKELNKSLTQEIMEVEAEAILAGLVTEWRAWYLAMQDSAARDEENTTGLIVPSSMARNLAIYKDSGRGLHEHFLEERCDFDVTQTARVAPTVFWRHCQAYFEDQYQNEKKNWPGKQEVLAWLDKLPGVRLEAKRRGPDRAPQRLWYYGIRILEPEPGSKEQHLAWKETIDRMTRDNSEA